MLPTTSREQRYREQRYKRLAKLLEDIPEEPSALSSEEHSSSRSSEQHSNSLYSEQTSSQQSSIETRTAASSSSRGDAARGHSRAHSKGKRPSSKALLIQRAVEVLSSASELHPDPNRGKEKHSSALDSRICEKSDEPESHILSL